MKSFKLRSLYAQLIFWGTIVVGLVGLVVYKVEVEALVNEAKVFNQRIYWNRASEYANELAPALGDNFNEAKLQELLLRLQRAHPQNDFYILNSDGSIRAHFPDPLAQLGAKKQPQMNAIDLRPVLSFLEQRRFPRGGILGADPYMPQDSKAFIAARVSLGSSTGYLYVVLGKSWDRLVPFVHRPWYYPWAAIIGSIVFLLWLLCWLLFLRPVRIILQALKRMTAGELEQRIPPCGRNELAEIAHKINAMADTIEATVGELKRADRLQREMTAALSHDFGTPLFAAQAYLDQIIAGQERLNAEEKEERLGVAARNLAKLRELVSSFFEMSKLDSRELTPVLEPFSILDLVTEEIVPKLRPLGESKRVILKTKYVEELPRVVGDVALIERVLTNLITNSINYNRPGGEVTVALSDKAGKIQVEAIDDGIGIRAEELPFIFDRFFRSDQSRSMVTGGSGLGLAIVKKILEAHNEEIQVESEIGKGTKFTFWLPAFSAAAR